MGLNMRQLLPTSLMALFCSISCFAGQWESAVVNVQAPSTEPIVEVVFRYTHDTSGLNKMPELGVLPEGVKLLPRTATPTPSSGTNTVLKEPVAVFRFQMPVGCLAGEHIISIPLANSAEPKELKVILKVPEFVEIKPRHLIWKKGDAAEPKMTSIVSVTREGVVLKKVEIGDDTFSAVLECPARQLYKVKITPKHTNTPHLTLIRVIGTDIYGKETGFNLYAEIQ
jgi:hypothetical protein